MSQINISNNPSAEVIIYENGTPVHVSVEGFVVTWGDIHGTLSAQTDLQNALNGKVDENAPITGATKTKITYDSKGLVTTGTDAGIADITGLQTALDLKVPYTGATGNVTLGEYGITAGYVQLDTTPTTYTPAVGNIGWNDNVGTIQTTLKGGTSLMVGRDMFERVVNKTGVQLTRASYQAVRISTAQGQRLGVALAQANNDNNSADTIGLAVETIDVNQEGMIFTVGEITGINTTGSLQGETWVDGDVLYLSPTTAGRITNVKPVAPQHLVVIGYVTYAHQNNGKIYVKTMNGWELGELHDVRITSPTNGQVLKYNSSLGIWENNTDAAGTGTVTQVNATGGTGISVSGSPITTSGTLTITNTAPDQVVSLTQGGTTTITGTYPNFTVSSADQFQGTVTSASVVSANGFAGTVANSTTTPAITLSTSVTGLLKGNGTAISAAVAGTDYQAALTNPVTGTGTSGQVSFWNGTTSQSGSNNLFWDSANNRLGVGTNSPARTFDVNGLAGFTGTTVSDGGQLGSELLSSANWTLGAGWTGDFSTGFAHSSGTATLTNTLAASNLSHYLISYTVTNRTTGSFTISFGGFTSFSLISTGSVGVLTTSTSSLVITPTTDFNGTIVLSIKFVSTSTASVQLRNSSGTITNEIRNDSSNTNTLIGTNAGSRNLSTNNTFIGSNAGRNTITGNSNTFIGQATGQNTINGSGNTFIGNQSGINNTIGGSNTFIGNNSGASNTTAFNNTFIGEGSGQFTTTGQTNTFIGVFAGRANTSAGSNTLIGSNSGLNQTTGSNNVAFGFDSGRRISGGGNLTVANTSLFIGRDTRANADSETNQIVIGDSAIGLGSNTTVIGNSSTTFGRWWGNLLVGTSTNSGFALDVNGTARIQGNLTTNLTSGSVPFIGASGLVTQDTSNLVWDNTNKRLGIGTNSLTPTTRLRILTDATNDNLWMDRFAAVPNFIFRRANGTESSPTAVLNNDNIGAVGFRGYNGSAFTTFSSSVLISYATENWNTGANGSDLRFETTATGGTTRTEKMRIFSGGNVLIQNGGTFTDAGFRLDVNGPARVQGNLTVGTAADASLALSAFRTVSTNQSDSNSSAVITSSSIEVTHRSSFLGIRSRGTLSSPTAVQSGDWISSFLSAGYDGSALQYSSAVLFQVDGAVSSGTVPQSIDFLTGTATSNRSTKLRVGSNGNVIIQNGGTFTDNGYRLDVQGTLRVTGASQFEGNVTLTDADNLVFGTTTGTKIGTATSQKLAFWNATPVVQPTTGIAEATFVENSGGTAVNVDSTFAGYTLQQIAQALKNIGILA